MLHEEEGTNHIGSVEVPTCGSWPPPDHGQSKHPMGFMTKVTRGPGGRPVEWPPRCEFSRSQEQLDQQENEAPNLTTTYPSGFKLKDQAGFQTGPAKVVTSQPAFKITQPIRRSGDDKWPPKGSAEPTQEEVREFVKPKKSNRNYEEFFAQNALPHNYAGYRPPPGTQHFGTTADGLSDM